MAWLLASVLIATVAVVGYAGTVTFVVLRDRRRWKRRRAALGLTLGKGDAAELQDGVTPAEIEFVQIWLDHQWEERFG